ncbi:hypothetical protein ACT8ZV_05240 [Nocardioides sp. MAHUQ-72]|uniref:hypothetical protein n=1 Tax=unclassified Nocardioides TaxID=2615069 RepID=UPI003614321B
MAQTNETSSSGVVCPDCHALVADLAAHAHWHSRLVADLAKAVEVEIGRRA